MRYKVTAQVEGNIHLNSPCSFNKGDYLFEFHTNNEERLITIAICIDVAYSDIDKYRSEISKKDGIVHLRVGRDAEVSNRIKNEFQILESNLSFISEGILKKIHWENAKEEFLPQNEEEKDYVKVLSLERRKEYPEPKTILKETMLEHYVINGAKYEELAIPKAFWREGMNYFTNFQYVQAFYNYYFITEDFYANGKMSEKEVMKEFARSSEFSEISDKTLKTFLNEERHGKKLLEMMKEENCTVDKAGLQKLLFNLRGRLHHYSKRGRKPSVSPFNQKEFETIALICGYIACLAIGYREVIINTAQRE